MMRQITLLFILLIASKITISTIAQKYPLPSSGKILFEQKCAKCHGKDGTKGFLGTKNLRTCIKNESELIQIILGNYIWKCSFK